VSRDGRLTIKTALSHVTPERRLRGIHAERLQLPPRAGVEPRSVQRMPRLGAGAETTDRSE